jgi:pyruvyltransferase
MQTINLHYWESNIGHGNFGDELSVYITNKLLNKNKYNCVLNSSYISDINLICIGSYIEIAKNDYYIFGSGIRTLDQKCLYNKLNVLAVRGPLTKKYLENKNIKVPDVYGDPALLLSKFYNPSYLNNLKDKIGIIPHISNYNNYKNIDLNNQFYLINPTDKWENIINQIYSCKAIISSSLHGLICSDAYNKPNLWLDEYKLYEGHLKFKDYFLSQNRDIIKIDKLIDYNETLLYTGGNKIDLNILENAFIFKF